MYHLTVRLTKSSGYLAHSVPGSAHPGVLRAIELIKTNWWPTMTRNVKSISHHALPVPKPKLGKLLPFENRHRPWSHLALDFLTDLPETEGTIMVTMDRFSRTLKLIPLPMLPTAFQTAELLFNRMFRYYGLPEDIVSNRGPQFVSTV